MVSHEIRQMGTSEIITKIRGSLEYRFESSHKCPPQEHEIVSHVRHVLVRTSGHRIWVRSELLGTQCKDIDLSFTFRYLFEEAESVRKLAYIDELILQVPSAQILLGSEVDQTFVEEYANMLSLELSA
ncbi:hypothetical protein ACHAO7_012003 [Fusarium culmorum]